MSLRFYGCTLDVEARRLFRGRDEVHLSPKAFETLRMLVEHRPRAMSKAELLERIWPTVVVSETSLARVINEIRDGLGDDRTGRMVRTLHSHGYAFVAEVESETGGPAETGRKRPVYWLTAGGRTLALYEGQQVIGRDPALELVLDSPKVSRHHARIAITQANATIEDLGSKNGTFVREQKIAGPTVVGDGDEVRIGEFRLVLRRSSLPPSTETEAERIV